MHLRRAIAAESLLFASMPMLKVCCATLMRRWLPLAATGCTRVANLRAAINSVIRRQARKLARLLRQTNKALRLGHERVRAPFVRLFVRLRLANDTKRMLMYPSACQLEIICIFFGFCSEENKRTKPNEQLYSPTD